jgi:hypothetical protein
MKVNIKKENCLITYSYTAKENWPPCVGEQLIEMSDGRHVIAGIALSWLPKHNSPIKRA